MDKNRDNKSIKRSQPRNVAPRRHARIDLGNTRKETLGEWLFNHRVGLLAVFAVFVLGPVEAILILSGRIFLGAVFAGNFSSILYSAAGGTLAILTTILMRKILKENQMWVASALGAMAHSIGQMIMAVLVTGTPSIAIYLPALLVCSIITGIFTGLCAQLLVNRGKKLWKTILN